MHSLYNISLIHAVICDLIACVEDVLERNVRVARWRLDRVAKSRVLECGVKLAEALAR